MRDLSTYPISFPFGATSAPYSPSRPHRGDDRAAPTGTPVVVGGTVIGLVGSTGLSSGPHCHTQEWSGSIGNVRKPQNTFKGGTVTAATQSSDFGNYVTIQTSDGWNTTYAHLSKINVSVGSIINNMPTTEEILQSALNREREVNRILESALNAEREKSKTFESALNAAREEIKQLQAGAGYEKLNFETYRKKI